MSIIGSFPATIANGQVEDATVVMTMFNWILAQTNANACPATSGSAMQKANGSGGLSAAVAWTDFVAPAAQVSVASAATTNFGGSGSPLLNLTGGTTISSGGTTYVGPVITRFATATSLTQSSTFNLLGGQNMTMAAGDYAMWLPQVGNTGWDMVEYWIANPTTFNASLSANVSTAGVVANTYAQVVDPYSNFNNGTGTFTIPATGTYLVCINAGTFSSATNQTCNASLYVNSSVPTYNSANILVATSGSLSINALGSAQAVKTFNTGDTVAVLLSSTGGNSKIYNFSITRIR